MDRVTKENTTLHDVWALMLGAVPGALPVCLCGRSGSGRRTLPRMAAGAGAARMLRAPTAPETLRACRLPCPFPPQVGGHKH